MATFVLEDLQSSIEVFVFPRTMTEVGHLLADDVVVCVKGRLDLRDEVPKIVCSELKRPQLTGDGSEPLQVIAARKRPGRHGRGAAAGAAPGAPGAVAGVPARRHQSGPPRPRVQRYDERWPAGGAAGTARTCLFVEQRVPEPLNLTLGPQLVRSDQQQ